MKKEEIGAKLQACRQQAGLTQRKVAEVIQRPQPTIASWEAGRSQPDADTLYSLLILYKVSPNTFFEYNLSSMNVSSKEEELVKLYRSLDDRGKQFVFSILEYEASRPHDCRVGNACIVLPKKTPFKVSEQPASAGTGTYLGPDGFEEIMIDPDLVAGSDFGVPVSGDSMEPRFHDGDIILISMSQPVEVGDIALVTMDGCGYVKKIGEGQLISLNKKYDPIPMTEDIRINGKVIGTLSPAQFA